MCAHIHKRERRRGRHGLRADRRSIFMCLVWLQVDLGLSMESAEGQFTNVLDELQAELGHHR